MDDQPSNDDKTPRLERPSADFLELTTRQNELLNLRNEVWGEATEELLDRVGVTAGQRVLDYGSGTGHVLGRLARRVGPGGGVLGVENNPLLAAESRRRLPGVRVFVGDLNQLGPEDSCYNAIISLWHFSRLDGLQTRLRRLRTLMLPQGRLGILDFHLEALAMYPHTPAFEKVRGALLDFYRERGVELSVSGRLPEHLLASGFLLEGVWPRQKAETPGSPSFRWLEALFFQEGPTLVEAELISEDDWEEFKKEWGQRRVDPTTLLFTPAAVSVVASAIV